MNRAAALAALRRVAQRLCAAHPEVKDVRVFGSIARGDHVGTSDADVLIVLERSPEGDPVERIRKFYRFFDLPIGVDLLVFTEKEIARRREAGEPFWEQTWQESDSLLTDERG